MTEPRVAVTLLQSFCRDEALIGDILEEYERRRSRGWLWRQVAVAVMFGFPYGVRRSTRIGARMPMPIGGLGVLAVAMLITFVAPGAWWLIGVGMAGGTIVAFLLVARRRHQPLQSDTGRHILS
jgi:hypothetical protein